MEKFEHNPKIAELDKELEKLDKERLVFLKELKAKAKKIKADRFHLHMVEQLTLRILNNFPLSAKETEWIEANPKEWKKIKEECKGKRGTRINGQTVVATSKPN